MLCRNCLCEYCSSPCHKNQKGYPCLISLCSCRMHTSYTIFCWMWYSFLKKGSPVYELAATGRNSLLLSVYDAVFNFFYIWFQRASQSKLRLWKKPTVMPTCSFIAEKKLEFSHLFSERFPVLRNSWLRVCKTIELIQRYFKGYFCDSNSFRRCSKQQLKMFR